ncbi:MAG: glycosyl hydrolase family 28 protein [Chitinophagaceae bacterium]|nr:glycosyl hydrolase family 28 protein [Chitinophagaceae bacterium]
MIKYQKALWVMIWIWCAGMTASAKDYPVLNFGAKNDGVTLNTTIIQGAIDYISENGGGRLVFAPGIYVTGSVYIKSNVTLHLENKAELKGSPNPFDYVRDGYIGWTSLVFSLKQENIGITGEGTINANGFAAATNMVDHIHKGIVVDALSLDRPDATIRPNTIYFRECEKVNVTGITQKDPGSWNFVIDQCTDVLIDRIHIDSKAYWNNDGIDIVDCDRVVIKNSYIDASDDAICFKSHDPSKICQNVVVDNCTVRSSASGLKFGTVNRGGFRNITVTNLKVIDTYRSAITIQSVDGGVAENILIDGVKSYNTANAIYIRMGDRWSGDKTSSLNNVTIKNVYAEIPLSKPDSGYRYEGPVEDLPRNISPSAIVGLPNWRIKDITLSNIEIVYPGGSNPHYAKRGTSKEELESIPEMHHAYPEFSQFKELPAWGFYVRHADNITFDNVVLKVKDSDYRPAIVIDDAKDIELKNINISEPESKKKNQIILNNTTKRKK